MRYRISTFLATALLLVSCTDQAPTTASMTPFGGSASSLALGDVIQGQIDAYLSGGLRNSVNSRWTSVRRKKDSGKMAEAIEQLNALSAWIDRKTGEITPPAGTSKDQAAALLIVNMARWVYGGPTAPPITATGPDVAVAVAPAGEEFFLQTPSEHAGVTWGAGSTNEDRIIVLAQDPNPYTGLCNGPLVTRRCQYPLFYILESYPKLKLNTPGRFAVCMVEDGDRRPLEYLPDETGSRPIDARMRVAHDKPANASDYTPGSTVEDGIEILPLSSTQSGELIECDEPNPLAMGPVKRTLYFASRFVGRMIAPRNAWAWDAGPEHDFAFFSNFNGVDPQSEPDLEMSGLTVVPVPAAAAGSMVATFTVSNLSRRTTGDATASSPASTVTLYRSANTTIGPEDTVVTTMAVPAMAPDAAPFTGSHAFVGPTSGYYMIASVATVVGEVSVANNVVYVPVGTPPAPTGQQEQPLFDTGFNWGIGGGPTSQEILAQVFTAGITGPLMSAAFPVGCAAGSTLVVEIRGVTAGVPNTTVLGSQSISAAALAAQTATFKEIFFTTQPNLSAGTQYALVLKTADLDNESCGISQGPVGDPYIYGDGFFDARPNPVGVWAPLGTRKDLPFKTTIAPPPILY